MPKIRRPLLFDGAVVVAIAAVAQLVATEPRFAAIAVGAAAAAGFTVGVIAHGGSHARPWRRTWWLLGVGLALSVVVNTGALPWPFGQDSLARPGWPVAGVVVTIAALRMLRQRVRAGANDAVSAAALAAAALGFVA